MSPFREQLILDLMRLGLAFGLFFVLMPRLLPAALYDPKDGGRHETPCARFVLTGTIYLALVHLLAALGVFDPLLYLGCVMGLAAMSLGVRYRGTRVVRAYAGVLRLLESGDRGSRLRRFVGSGIGFDGSSRPSCIVASALILAVLLVRARPFWASLNPSSFTFYDVLHEVKSLRVGQLFPGGVLEERGLHAFALALHTFSQVGVGSVVLLVGLISVLVLGYVIFHLTSAGARSQLAGVTAASLFGIVGVWWPPLGLRIHTQADPLPLATAFLLVALFFAARYILEGKRPDLLVVSAALLSCAMISVSAAAIGGALLGMGALACLLLPPRTASARALLVLVLGSGMLLVSGMALWTGPHVVETVDPYRVPRFEVVTNTIGNAAARTVPGTLIALSVLVAGALTWMSRMAAAPISGMAARASGLGVAVLGGIAWLNATSGIEGIDPRTPVFLLSVFLCVAAGLLVGPLWREATLRVESLMDATAHRKAFVAGCLMVGGSIWPAVPLPRMDPDSIQPRGYAHAYENARRIAEPGDWTVVGHEGLRVQVRYDGFFMGYEEFLRTVHLDDVLGTQGGRHLTRDLFVFVDVRPDESAVRDELNPPPAETSRRLGRLLAGWTVRSRRVSVFHEDESVRVYRIRTPQESITGRPRPLAYGGDS